MKKRKQPEQNRPDFSNNPFSPLKKFKPADAPSRAAGKTPPRPVSEADDEDLFRRAVTGARRLDQEEGPQLTSDRAVQKPAHGAEEDAALFLRAMSGTRPMGSLDPAPGQAALDEEDRGLFVNALKMGSSLPPVRIGEDEEEIPARSPSSRMKQLKRGTIRISEELDLHGSLREEALGRLKVFIANAFVRGQRAVLVITGKGINSPEGPVLQGAVADWLRGPGKGMVAEFCPAPRDRGGSGAYVVFLKSR